MYAHPHRVIDIRYGTVCSCSNSLSCKNSITRTAKIEDRLDGDLIKSISQFFCGWLFSSENHLFVQMVESIRLSTLERQRGD